MTTNYLRLIRPRSIHPRFLLSKRRVWYAEEPPPAPNDPPANPAPTPNPVSADNSSDDEMPDWVKDPARAMEAIKKLRKEAADYRKQTRDLQAEKDLREKELSEAETQKLAEDQKWQTLAEKYKGELEKERQTYAQKEHELLKKSIGLEFKLPPELVVRLQGTTEDELRQDATLLVKVVGLDKSSATPTPEPEQNTPALPPLSRGQSTTTAVPGGQPVTRTDADRRNEYFGGKNSSPMFNPANGGKVIFHGNPSELE